MEKSDNVSLVEQVKEQELLLNQCKSTEARSQHIAIDLYSLPWSATQAEIKSFFPGVNIIKVLIVLNEYRKPSGEARVWVDNEEEVETVLTRNGENMGSRKVRVRRAVTNQEKLVSGEFLVKMESLPWTVTPEQITSLLFGSDVLRVELGQDERGRASGDALVTVRSVACQENALRYNKQMIGNRNVVIKTL